MCLGYMKGFSALRFYGAAACHLLTAFTGQELLSCRTSRQDDNVQESSRSQQCIGGCSHV